MKSAVLAARDNRGPDELLEMNGWHGDTMTSDPDYETPFVKDLELVFVVFDVLYLRDQVLAPFFLQHSWGNRFLRR